MKYIALIILIWILCGILDLIIFPIRNEYNQLDETLKEELRFFESKMGIGYWVILWTTFLICASISGPINLYRSWKDK